MAIVVFCPSCSVRLTLGDERAGSALECPNCETVIGIPALLPPPPKPAPPPFRRPTPPPPAPPAPADDWSALPPEPAPSHRMGKRAERSGLVTAVAILYAVCGALNLFCAAILLAGGMFLAGGRDITPDSRLLITGAATLIAFVVVLLGVPNLLAAYGIWHRRHWGYVLGLVLAGFNLLWAFASIFWGDVCSLFVCGASGVFALVVLLNQRYSAEFN